MKVVHSTHDVRDLRRQVKALFGDSFLTWVTCPWKLLTQLMTSWSRHIQWKLWVRSEGACFFFFETRHDLSDLCMKAVHSTHDVCDQRTKWRALLSFATACLIFSLKLVTAWVTCAWSRSLNSRCLWSRYKCNSSWLEWPVHESSYIFQPKLCVSKVKDLLFLRLVMTWVTCTWSRSLKLWRRD